MADTAVSDQFLHEQSLTNIGSDPNALGAVKWDGVSQNQRADGKVETLGYDAKTNSSRLIKVADGEKPPESTYSEVEENGVKYRIETKPDGSTWFLGRADQSGGMSIRLTPPKIEGAPTSDTPSDGKVGGQNEKGGAEGSTGKPTGEGEAGAQPEERLIDSVVDDMTGMVQGVVPAALKDAKPAPKELSDLYADESVPEAQRRALVTDLGAKQGLEIGFRRVEGTTRFEPVVLTPEMKPPGGRIGQVADFLGRLLGWNDAEPIAGVAKGVVQGAKAAKTGKFAAEGAMGMGGTIADQEKNLLVEEAYQFLKDKGQVTAPFASRSSAATDDIIMKSAVRQGWKPMIEFKPGQGKVPAHIVYHGSPHDFEVFDMSKIGTGEGAQVFGHGLYFADKEDLAKYYKDTLIKRHNDYSGHHVFINGEELMAKDTWPGPDFEKNVASNLLRDYLIFAEGDVGKAIKNVDKRLKEFKRVNPTDTEHDSKVIADLSNLKKTLQSLEGKVEHKFQKPTGSLHHVFIPADDTMILWDKTLAEQPPKVKEAFEKMIEAEANANGAYGKGNVADIKAVFTEEVGFDPDKKVPRVPTLGELLQGGDEDGSIHQVFQNLLLNLANKHLTPEEFNAKAMAEVLDIPESKHVSELLQQYGISGIKYLNGVSRKKGEGDFNYVVFDDELIKTLAKYGIAGAALVGASTAGSTDAEASTRYAGLLEKLGIGKKLPVPHPEIPLGPGARDIIAQPYAEGAHAAQGDLWAGYKAGKPEGIDFNFDNMRTNEGVLEQINNVSRAYKETIDAQKGGVISHDTTRQVADLLGVDEAAAQRAVESLPSDTKDLHVRVTVMRDMLVASAERVDNAARVVMDEHSGPADLLKFRETLAHHAVLQANMKGVQTEIARALSAFNIPATAQPFGKLQLTQEMINAMGGDSVTRDLARRWIETPAEAKGAFAQKGAWAKTMESVKEVWINGLLSAVKTNVVNVASTIGFMAWQVPERAVAGAIGTVRKAVLPNANQEQVYISEAAAMLHGYLEGIPDAFRLGWSTFKNEVPASGTATKLEAQQRQAITAQNYGLDEGSILGRFVDLVGMGVRMPGRLLMTQDEFNKAISRAAQSRAIALRTMNGVLDTGGTVEEAKAAYMHALTGQSAEAENAINQFADMATFTKPLGEKGQAFQNLIQKIPMGWVMAPFQRTPGNIFTEEFLRTPAGLLMKPTLDAIKAGGAQADLALARVSLGTATMAYAGYMAANGQITGYGPQDPKMRAVWLEKYQPYSVKIGDKWYPYGKLEPLAGLLGMAADIAQFRQWAPRDVAQQDWDALTMRAFGAVVNNIAERSFMQGFADFVQAVNDHERYGESYLARLEASFAQPVYSSLLREAENANDPTRRVTSRDPNEHNPLYAEFYRMLNEVKARTPGFSKDLPPRLNFWGEEVKAYEGNWVNAFNPFAPRSDKSQPIDEELIRLRYPITDIQPAVQGVRLTPQQQHNLVKAVNELKVPHPGGGDTQVNMREYMNWLVEKSPMYKAILDEKKVEAIKHVRDHFVDAGGKYLLTPGSPYFDADLLSKVTTAKALQGVGLRPQ